MFLHDYNTLYKTFGFLDLLDSLESVLHPNSEPDVRCTILSCLVEALRTFYKDLAPYNFDIYFLSNEEQKTLQIDKSKAHMLKMI